jgi:hypothetical protein
MSGKSLHALFLLPVLLGAACQNHHPQRATNNAASASVEVTHGSPVVDGSGADAVWDNSEWLPIDRLWQGAPPSSADFQGRYKVAWDENNLYLLIEIDDDTLTENTTSTFEVPRLADCLVIFIDEDTSGGERAPFNAFAYHLSSDGRVFNAVPDSVWNAFDDHCWVRRIGRDNTSTWEIALRVYDGKQYRIGGENIPKLLKGGKRIGFALAYGDRDGGPQWENVVGNIPLNAQKPEAPWKNADGYLTLNLLR